jgi:hypothetical protein
MSGLGRGRGATLPAWMTQNPAPPGAPQAPGPPDAARTQAAPGSSFPISEEVRLAMLAEQEREVQAIVAQGRYADSDMFSAE